MRSAGAAPGYCAVSCRRFRLLPRSLIALALRAPRHTALLKIVEDAALRRIIEHDPGDQCGHHEHRHRIGGDDEIRVRPQIHAWSSHACINRIARTRRRKISLRMAARNSVTNNSVNAAAMISSGHKIDGSMAEPPRRRIEAG